MGCEHAIVGVWEKILTRKHNLCGRAQGEGRKEKKIARSAETGHRKKRRPQKSWTREKGEIEK